MIKNITSLEQLFPIQMHLDKSILEKCDARGIQTDEKELWKSKILALIVEIGELANETKCFKYWSEKHNQCTDKVLEEYVDCLHFILSLGNYSGNMLFVKDYSQKVSSIFSALKKHGYLRTDLFLLLNQSVERFREYGTFDSYEEMYVDFLVLGLDLGFRKEKIIAAYLEKNKINYQRQQEGY